ncbi:phospholipid phosphatase 5 [Chrysoperla carnea]|uniref:phospholipid phosphatase 5 n=1 Tax=Chrysoperla carnea TaxID=189513 RepID=UPI001D076A0F|nr:phospholipid phosphatase 5 [Chrysoperla carnea]
MIIIGGKQIRKVLARIPPFHREIQSQELWLYSYPSVPRYFPGRLFYPLVLVIPLCAIWWFYQTSEDDIDVIEGFLSVTLSFSVTLLLVEILKNVIGRPRPNFLAKCFPDGNLPEDLICSTGTFYDIQSRKSFPSGHAARKDSNEQPLKLY